MLLVIMSLFCTSNIYAAPAIHGYDTSVEEESDLLPKEVKSDTASETSTPPNSQPMSRIQYQPNGGMESVAAMGNIRERSRRSRSTVRFETSIPA